MDTSRFFVITVGAIGDGDSSSPSNSTAQPRMRFPKFTIRDMVASQHSMLTEVLKLKHLYAVIGISMGGMQTFQWAVSYPDFFDKAIPIVGSPQLTSYDLLLWDAELHAIEEDRDWKGGDYTAPPPLQALLDIHNLNLTTPTYRVSHTPRSGFEAYLNEIESNGPDRFDANNWHRQLEAMLLHDVAAPWGGSLEKPAGTVKAKFFVVVSAQDHMVNPTPARAFARLLKAPVFELTGPCGHIATGCEETKLDPAVATFLRK